MSWREVLKVTDAAPDAVTQNPHNAQKPLKPDISADIADSAQQDSKLMEVLATACRGLSITPMEVYEALAPEDLDDWHEGAISLGNLAAFARSLIQRREMDKGQVPEHYTERATCKQCGPVWLWFGGEVLGCPWCWNRIANRPLPRP
jgi:hypothetical protein